jgi:hypothetical protein
MKRINAEINKVFKTIIDSISNKSTDEDISIITKICCFFMNLDIMKSRLTKSERDIENIYS